jgi:predicted Zn-dependent protease
MPHSAGTMLDHHAMNAPFARMLRLFMAALILATSTVSPALAQSDDLDSGPSLLRDTETELLFKQMSRPLIVAAGLDPNSVEVVLLNDPEINAFVSKGQTVYVQSGLLEATDNVNQLQGVVAHELGHVLAGDVIRSGQGEKQATGVALLSLVLAAAAIAAGAGEAGMGIMQAGQRAALGEMLAFTRAQEATADASGAIFLAKSGISGKGMLDFFGKLQKEEYRYGYFAKDSFDRDHPLSSERIQALEQKLKSDPAWGTPIDPALEARFDRVKAKLLGFVNPKKAVTKYPETDQSVAAHYARAYAYHLGGYPDKARAEADALIAKDPHDPFFLELKGQILLEGGEPRQAIPVLREAAARSGNAPLIATMLGHALVATDDAKNYPEAKQILKVAINRDNQDPFAWYQLGVIYEHEGDEPRAALATAERNNLQGNVKMAYASAQMALKGIPPNTPDYLRAQDIAMVARAELAKKDKKYRDRKELRLD